MTTTFGSQPADFIRASSHAVLREQAEHMDAPDRCSSLHKSSCATGVVHTWTYNDRSIAQLRWCRVVHAITSVVITRNERPFYRRHQGIVDV